jgi:hypothetical protein
MKTKGTRKRRWTGQGNCKLHRCSVSKKLLGVPHIPPEQKREAKVKKSQKTNKATKNEKQNNPCYRNLNSRSFS